MSAIILSRLNDKMDTAFDRKYNGSFIESKRNRSSRMKFKLVLQQKTYEPNLRLYVAKPGT